MKKLTIEQKAQRYKEALEKANIAYKDEDRHLKATLESIFPELNESKEERIRRVIRGWIYTRPASFFDNGISKEEILAWLEKQDDTNGTINRDEFAQGVLRGAAINLITWIDYNAPEGNTCLSNMECKDIENALVSGDWNKIYAYIKKKLEKQGGQPQEKSALEIPKGFNAEIDDNKVVIKKGEKPTAWSEEDEHRVKDAIYFLDAAKKHYASVILLDACIDWLKSLKQRIGE